MIEEQYKKVNEIADEYFRLGVPDIDIIRYFNRGNTTVRAISKRLGDAVSTEVIADVLRDRVAEYIDTNNIAR